MNFDFVRKTAKIVPFLFGRGIAERKGKYFSINGKIRKMDFAVFFEIRKMFVSLQKNG